MAILIRAHHQARWQPTSKREDGLCVGLSPDLVIVSPNWKRLHSNLPRTPDRAWQLLTKLQTLDSDFRTVHLELINEANTEALDAEQKCLDKLDDDVSGLTVRLEALINPATPPTEPVAPPRRPLTRKLARVQTGLNHIDEAIAPIDTPVDRALLSQYQEELQYIRVQKDSVTLYEELTAKNVADDELFVTHSALDKQLFSTSHKMKSLLVVP